MWSIRRNVDKYLKWDFEKLIKLQDDDYYGLLKQLLKKGYNVDTLKKELSMHKKKVGGLNLEEMNLDNNVLYRMAQNNYGEVTHQIIIFNSYRHQAMHLSGNCRTWWCTSYLS